MKKTLENLSAAFVGESQARNRYTRYAKVAKKEGYEQIAAIFLETADQEKEHAAQLFKRIQELKEGDEAIKVDAEVPNTIGDTASNLKAAAEGENFEYTEMYPGFADQAEKDGLKEIADQLRAIGKAEEHHEERYNKLLEEVTNNTVFEKKEETMWLCRECGYVHVGTTPPDECPSCFHAKAYYHVKCEKY